MKKKIKSVEEAIKELPIVEFLESRTKVGFRTQVKNDKEDFEPLFRLVCDDSDPDKSDPVICTPYCTAQALSTLVQGFLYLSPIIGKVLHDAHKNAAPPQETQEAHQA